MLLDSFFIDIFYTGIHWRQGFIALIVIQVTPIEGPYSRSGIQILPTVYMYSLAR